MYFHPELAEDRPRCPDWACAQILSSILLPSPSPSRVLPRRPSPPLRFVLSGADTPRIRFAISWCTCWGTQKSRVRSVDDGPRRCSPIKWSYSWPPAAITQVRAANGNFLSLLAVGLFASELLRPARPVQSGSHVASGWARPIDVCRSPALSDDSRLDHDIPPTCSAPSEFALRSPAPPSSPRRPRPPSVPAGSNIGCELGARPAPRPRRTPSFASVGPGRGDELTAP